MIVSRKGTIHILAYILIKFKWIHIQLNELGWSSSARNSSKTELAQISCPKHPDRPLPLPPPTHPPISTHRPQSPPGEADRWHYVMRWWALGRLGSVTLAHAWVNVLVWCKWKGNGYLQWRGFLVMCVGGGGTNAQATKGWTWADLVVLSLRVGLALPVITNTLLLYPHLVL